MHCAKELVTEKGCPGDKKTLMMDKNLDVRPLGRGAR
jgi:hypothetical protein